MPLKKASRAPATVPEYTLQFQWMTASIKLQNPFQPQIENSLCWPSTCDWYLIILQKKKNNNNNTRGKNCT